MYALNAVIITAIVILKKRINEWRGGNLMNGEVNNMTTDEVKDYL